MNLTFLKGRGSRGKQRTEPGVVARSANGFTLMELLIVMAIIAILMIIGIPSSLAMMKKTRELSARQSLKTIQQAEQMYQDAYPTLGFTCSLAALGGDPHSGPPSATSAQMLPDDLAAGDKSGYVFTISNCIKSSQSGSQRITSYQITDCS